MSYRTIDLCAGIGGIRRGFELTGCFENVLSAEIDEFAAKTYEHLYGENPLNDLTSETFKSKVAEVEYDVLLAGFPCQAFSRVGKQLGFRDKTRGTIFFDIADIISRTTPKAIFLENVENLISHDKGQTIETIVDVLEDELGYRVIGVSIDDNGDYSYSAKSFVRNTKNFGLPQNRPRAYIMAFSKKHYGEAIKSLIGQLPESNHFTIYPDVSSVLEDDVADHYYLASGYLQTLINHKNRQNRKGYGFGYRVVNEEGSNGIASTILATGGSGKERNLVYQPKDGVSGKIVKGKKTPLNSEGIRMMTPLEWGRLQGFVNYAFVDKEGIDHFSFPQGVTDAQKYKQFGNSVSVPVIESMAEFMLECFAILQNQQVEIVRSMVENNPFITKRDVMQMLNINAYRAGILLKEMIKDNVLIKISSGKATKYIKYCEKDCLPAVFPTEMVLQMAEQSGDITNDDVVAVLGWSKNSVNVLLCNMYKSGQLLRKARGVYCLPEGTLLSNNA